MISPYRESAVPGPQPPRRWTFAELVRAGKYYGDPLLSDRWTGFCRVPSASRDGPRGIPEQAHSFVEGARMIPFENAESWICGRVRPATLAELLWFGLHHPDALDEMGCDRLYACGSIGWRHWAIDGQWTRHVAFLSRCPGYVRLAEIDALDVAPSPKASEKIAFLCVR